MIRIVQADSRRVAAFNARPAFPDEAEQAAASVLADIRRDGDRAVRRAVARFEGFKGSRLRLDVDAGALERQIDPKLVRAVKDAHRRVLRFSKA